MMDSIYTELTYGSEAHWSVHKAVVAIMDDFVSGAIVAELLEQSRMARIRGINRGDWFPFTYKSVADRMHISVNKVQSTVQKLLEMNLYTSKRIGIPSKLYYRLNAQLFHELVMKTYINVEKARDEESRLNLTDRVPDSTTDSNPDSTTNSENTGTEKVKRIPHVRICTRAALHAFKSFKDLKKEINKEKKKIIGWNKRKVCKQQPAANAAVGADAPRVALVRRNTPTIKPILVRRITPIVKAPVNHFRNDRIEKIFRHWCDKGILTKHKIDPEHRTFQLIQKHLAKALRTYSVSQIIQAIDDYCTILTEPGFYVSLKYNRDSMVLFFEFDEHTRIRYEKHSTTRGMTSWFDECIQGFPHLVKRFGNPDFEIDEYPKITEALIAAYNRHQRNIVNGAPAKESDKKYFVRSAKIVVSFHQKHKSRINWGSRQEAYHDISLFASLMIDARFHFSSDNVTMVKPSWFSSEKAEEYLTDFLLAKGMIDRSSKSKIQSNVAEPPVVDLYLVNARNREIAKQRKLRERIAEEQEYEED